MYLLSPLGQLPPPHLEMGTGTLLKIFPLPHTLRSSRVEGILEHEPYAEPHTEPLDHSLAIPLIPPFSSLYYCRPSFLDPWVFNQYASYVLFSLFDRAPFHRSFRQGMVDLWTVG